MIVSGPRIAQDGLVACYDAYDGKSYYGEPTENILLDRTSGGGTWWGDGSDQSIGAKSVTTITDPDLMYSGYDTVLWTPGSSRNVYLTGTQDIPYSETSTLWTFSSYLKYEDNIPITSLSVYMYYPSSDGNAAGTIYSVGNGWYRVSRTRTGSDSYISLVGFTGFSSNKRVYISGWQLERKEYVSPYVQTGTERTINLSLKDRVTNDYGTTNNITGSNVYQNRVGSIITPYTNAYINYKGNATSYTTVPGFATSYDNYTLEFWIKINGASDNDRFYTWNQGGTLTVRWRSSNYFQFHYNPVDGSPASTQINGNTVTTPSGWHHVVVTNNAGDASTGAKVYTDGVVGAGGEPAVALGTVDHILGMGLSGIVPCECDIAVFRIYNRDLSAKEVLGNYRAMKGRFNL